MSSLDLRAVVYELSRFSRSVLMLATSDCFCTIFSFRAIFLCSTFELLLADGSEPYYTRLEGGTPGGMYVLHVYICMSANEYIHERVVLVEYWKLSRNGK